MWYAQSLESNGRDYDKRDQLSHDQSQSYFALKQERSYSVRGRRHTFDPEHTPYSNSPPNYEIDHSVNSYNDAYYAQRLSPEFISMDRRPRSMSLCSQPDTPRSVTNRSSPTTVIAPPCRQLPCRYVDTINFNVIVLPEF
jgi:hypothetical protein